MSGSIPPNVRAMQEILRSLRNIPALKPLLDYLETSQDNKTLLTITNEMTAPTFHAQVDDPNYLKRFTKLFDTLVIKMPVEASNSIAQFLGEEVDSAIDHFSPKKALLQSSLAALAQPYVFMFVFIATFARIKSFEVRPAILAALLAKVFQELHNKSNDYAAMAAFTLLIAGSLYEAMNRSLDARSPSASTESTSSTSTKPKGA